MQFHIYKDVVKVQRDESVYREFEVLLSSGESGCCDRTSLYSSQQRW